MEDLRRLVIEAMEDYKKEVNKQLDKHEVRLDKHDERMDQLNSTQIINGQQIAGIIETLKDIKGDTVWLRRTVTGAVIGGAISAIIGFIVFAIQKLN